VSKVAKKAGQIAAKIGLGPILNKIKALVRPLLDKVLQTAIGRLPEAVRPAAQQLAERIFGRKRAAPDTASPPPLTAGGPDVAGAGAQAPAAEEAGSAVQEPAGSGATEIQQEFDQQLASLFTASDEVEMELEVTRARTDARRPTVPVYSDLDQARERFIDELHELSEGEDPAPHIQNFLPALLPALRLGVRLAGRGRVVGFLAGFLSKMIAKLIGPATAPALSRAIVDEGLKLLTLETSPQDEAKAAAAAVAATVEETVRRVTALPDYVLDNQELLEGFALEAFEQSAAANLPPVLSEAVYRERPDLLESQGVKTCWVMLPLGRPKRYKKCARTFNVRITPCMAGEIESFEGPLSDYLQDQFGVEEGAEVQAELELFETLPGTTVPDIAREESETRGGGWDAGRVAAPSTHAEGCGPADRRAEDGAPHAARHAPAARRSRPAALSLANSRPAAAYRGRQGRKTTPASAWRSSGHTRLRQERSQNLHLPERGQSAAAGCAAAATVASWRGGRRFPALRRAASRADPARRSAGEDPRRATRPRARRLARRSVEAIARGRHWRVDREAPGIRRQRVCRVREGTGSTVHDRR
jgi:hypothetical protein